MMCRRVKRALRSVGSFCILTCVGGSGKGKGVYFFTGIDMFICTSIWKPKCRMLALGMIIEECMECWRSLRWWFFPFLSSLIFFVQRNVCTMWPYEVNLIHVGLGIVCVRAWNTCALLALKENFHKIVKLSNQHVKSKKSKGRNCIQSQRDETVFNQSIHTSHVT